MRYWWVNQKQTHRHEIAGGYLWSPVCNKNGARNQSYENMKLVSPGDIVFGYWNTAIRAVGRVASFCYDSPKPQEFGRAGLRWSDSIGYRVDVVYSGVPSPLRPRDHWSLLQPLLPEKYSPLNRENGKGLQSFYLAALDSGLGELLARLVVFEQAPVPYAGQAQVSGEFDVHQEWERHLESAVRESSLDSTVQTALIRARRGQGRYRESVMIVERCCRVTGVADPAYLIASHIKPWRHSDNSERLDGNNGLLLTPDVDWVFDRGFISFDERGTLLASCVANEGALTAMGIRPGVNVGAFTDAQQAYLEHHRSRIFKSA